MGEKLPERLGRMLEEMEARYEHAKRVRFVELKDRMLKHGVEVFCGYVDDPRTTDNAWIETRAVHFHASQCAPCLRCDISVQRAAHACGPHHAFAAATCSCTACAR